MSFKDEITEHQNNTSGIDRIMNSMSEEDAEDLMLALQERNGGEYRYQASKIADALRKRGYKISDRAVQRYRKEKLT